MKPQFDPNHLRAWFTPERRKIISTRALDELAGRPLGTLSRFLAGEKHMTFARVGIGSYLPFLELLGYEPPSTRLQQGLCNLPPLQPFKTVS